MVNIKVKWGKEVLKMEIDVSLGALVFKAQLQSLTGVPADRQKISGVKGGALKDDCENLADVGVTEGKMLMLIGSAEGTTQAGPQKPVVFAEDKKDLADEVLTTGLSNLGNTCYLNSALQSLKTCPELKEVLKDGNSAVEKQLGNVFGTLDATKEPVAPMAFLQTFMLTFPTFASTDDNGRLQQQDSQEALGQLIQCFTSTIDTKAQFTEQYKALFRGQMQRTTTPLGIEGAEPTKENTPFNILPCNIDAETETLEAGLEKSMTEQFTAARDGQECVFNRTSKLGALPEYLFVQFVRFAWRKDTKQKAKSLKPVAFPLILDVNMLCSDELKKTLIPEREEVKKARDEFVENRKRLRQKTKFDEAEEQAQKKKREDDGSATDTSISTKIEEAVSSPAGNHSGYYELCAVISHKGRDADGGHYVSWVKKKDVWLVCDDANVAVVSEEDIKHLKGSGEAHIAYVLMYRSRDPDTKAFPMPL